MAGITSTKKIKGQPHLLAYITPNEVKKLKALGGQETMTPEGIPAYPEYDNYGFSSQADFDSGDVSRSSDANVRGEGVNFDGTPQNRVTAAELARRNMKEKIEQGFPGQSKVNPGFFEIGGKKDRRNKAKRQRFINYLINEKKKNLQKGLMDPSIPGVDVMTMEEMISLAPSVQDLVNKGFYKSDGAFAKGEKIPSYNINPNMPGILGMVMNQFDSPVTSDKLKDYYNQINTLENLNPMNPNNNIQNLMKTYQPNRFNLGKTDGRGNPYILPQYAMMGGGADLGGEDAVEEKTYDYRFGTGQDVGLDVTQGFYNQGGRVPKAFGGIMDKATGRKAYGLGSIFKKVGKAAKKVLSSDIGKAAIAGAAIYYGGGGTFKPGGSSTFEFGNLFNSNNKLLFSGAGTKADPNRFNPLKFTGITTLFGALAGPAKVDQMPGDDGTRGGRLIDPLTGEEGTPASMRANIENAKIEAGGDEVKLAALNQAYNNMLFSNLPYANYGTYAEGGRIKAQEGGLMNLGGMEKDYRAEGGFVPIGKEEKADDVPARLSVNEFVFTADAVRNAGGGDIDKGAEIMENMMTNLENGGRVSEESQGNAGAQNMFGVSERIGEVI